MHRTAIYTALAALLLVAGRVSAQSVTYNFADGTSDGWDAGGFSDSTPLSVIAIGGANYITIPSGGFQVANVATGNASSALFEAMQAAALNPAGYDISYNWSVDTSTFSGSTFLQLGTFVNTGSGYYAQDYGADEVQLSGAQIATGGVFQGSVSVNMAAIGFTMPTSPLDTFYRLGIIENSNGTGVAASFTNISVSPVSVPEPASLSLLALGSGLMLRRRKA